jgi:hypothetical protein
VYPRQALEFNRKVEGVKSGAPDEYWRRSRAVTPGKKHLSFANGYWSFLTQIAFNVIQMTNHQFFGVTDRPRGLDKP